MFARVATYSGDVDELSRGFEAACSYLEDAEGFMTAYFLMNRSSAKALTMTLWEDEESLDASALRAHQLRSWALEPAGATTDSVTEYEVGMVFEKAGAAAGN